MNEIKFSCPQCGQHIACDETYSGQQIACPNCQQALVVPQRAVSDASAPQAQSKLSIDRAQSSAPGAPPPRPVPVYQTYLTEPEKKGGAMKILGIVTTCLAFGVGAYFGFRWVQQLQHKTTAKLDEAAKKSDGGEAGHIANIYKTLDMTDPDHPGMTSAEYEKIKKHEAAEAAKRAAARGDNLAIVQPSWSLDASAAEIPQTKVNGLINGTNFVAGIVRFNLAKGMQILQFTQGDVRMPDREILLYFHFNAGEKPDGKIFLVTADSHAQANPGIVKRWLVNSKYGFQTKSFTSGYVLKLEFGQMNADGIHGRIYLALPDAEKSVIAGIFNADLALPGLGDF